jgi:hypothetical protein
MRRFEITRARGLRAGTRARKPDPERFYSVDARTLPPGIDPRDLVSVVRLEQGVAVGGTSWWIVPRPKSGTSPRSRLKPT